MQLTGETQAGLAAPRRLRWPDAARHCLCVLALMWTGVVNGQPFFFADSTNYIRAADLAVHLASGRTISTVWTERYRSALPDRNGSLPKLEGEAIHPETANDLRAGLVMSGRSPYIGALMYAGWVLGWFWPFVILQATIAYGLIILTLRRFALASPRNVTAVTLSLAALTSLPTYNSLLLADGFASFGVLAFALLAVDDLSKGARLFLTAVLVMATIAHLTHLMMLFGMIAIAAVLAFSGWLRPPRRFWYVAVGTVVLAIAALQATSFATRLAVGRDPQLLPLLTARFYMDGPGRAFIAAGCEGNRFQVCRIPIKRPVNNAGWLFDPDPEVGAYMLATPAQRRLMGEEDVAFATAVLRAYPARQIGASAWNALRQLVWIDYDNLNQGCAPGPLCWPSLPPEVHHRFDRSLSGRNAWPAATMNALLYITVIGSLIMLTACMTALRRRDRSTFVVLRNVVLIVGTAMLVCSIFGGAVADPQYRYQGRLIWLLVLFAAVALLATRRVDRSAAMVPALDLRPSA